MNNSIATLGKVINPEDIRTVKRIDEMKAKIEKLETEMAEMKAKQTKHVEKIARIANKLKTAARKPWAAYNKKVTQL